MKKKNLLLLATSMLVLASCGGPASSSATGLSTSEPSQSQSRSSASLAPDFEEVETNDLPSGEYSLGNIVYKYDKDTKKLTRTKYEDYEAYKAGTGTKELEVAVKFVQYTSTTYGSGIPAIYFLDGTKHNFISKNDKNARIETIHYVDGVKSYSTLPMAPVSELIPFTLGNYVSSKEFEQYKVDDQGKVIYDEPKEKFYLFLELTATKAAIYVGENNQTHRETPLHSVENYKTLFSNGMLRINIPHVGGDFACTLTSKTAGQIEFNNSYEKRGDYSASGTFVGIVA